MQMWRRLRVQLTRYDHCIPDRAKNDGFPAQEDGWTHYETSLQDREV